jgi:DnaA family protein
VTRQLPLAFPLRERFTFERFAIGGNAELVEHLRHRELGFDAMWLWGRSGVGKSHLIQAVCHEASVVYVPARELTDLAGYEVFDQVLIDDLDNWIGDRLLEEELLQLYNDLKALGHRLVVTAQASPTRVRFALADLESRMRSAGCFEVKPLVDEAAVPVLKRAANDRGLRLGDEVISFLLTRAARDLPELLDLLEVIDREAMSARRRVTVPFVKRVLAL